MPSVESAHWSRRSCTTCRAMTMPARCASATVPTTRCSTISGARSWTRCICTPIRVSRSPTTCGRCSSSRSRKLSNTGVNPTAASGRYAASRSTSPRRRSCAGWPWTAGRSWQNSRARSPTRSSGAPSLRRSRPTFWPTASTHAEF